MDSRSGKNADNSEDKTLQLVSNETVVEKEETPTYKAKFVTTKGEFIIEVHPDWSPRGAARFRELVESGFYNDCALFRVVNNFMAQFGISNNPEANRKWRDKPIKDDPVQKSNTRGRVTFAKTGLPDSRTTQIFINYEDNSRLNSMGFAPFAEVVSGMDVVDSFYSAYGERTTQLQGQIAEQGNAFLKEKFPELDYIETVEIIDAQ
ncbi:MAG: peptidylprolyl isomerase [Planctomycetaceae bacterium]